MRSWIIVTPEYPPEVGGVADFTHGIARGLSERGEPVRVLTPRAGPAPPDPGVQVIHLADRFLARSYWALERELRSAPKPPIVLLQYVPQGMGLSGLNLPFMAWLAARCPRLWVMFHEVVFPFIPGQSFARHLLALNTRAMLAPLASRAERCLVSTEAWVPYLIKWGRPHCQPEWMPVPSNLPARAERPAHVVRDALGLSHAGKLLFHFGTYSPIVVEPLRQALPLLLRHRERALLLLGRGSERFRKEVVRQYPDLDAQLVATGTQPAQQVVDAMAACDAAVYPFPDGVSGRRTSLMAALQLGVPAFTTEGNLSEALWRSSGAVALAPALDARAFAELVDSTLSNDVELRRLGAAGQRLYEGHFSRERCLEHLLAGD